MREGEVVLEGEKWHIGCRREEMDDGECVAGGRRVYV